MPNLSPGINIDRYFQLCSRVRDTGSKFVSKWPRRRAIYRAGR